MTEEAVVWKGPEALRPFLVPIDSLEPFPNNPRLGDPPRVADSLRRFGQQKNVVVDGRRIVAGHHVVLGANLLGWTHVVAFPNDFEDDEEARAFLIADNRTSDLGSYDLELLVAHLRELRDLDALEGTGYTDDDVDDRLAELRARLDTPPTPPPPVPQAGDVREVVLVFGADQHAQFEEWVKVVAHEKGTNGVSETVYAAMEVAVDAFDG